MNKGKKGEKFPQTYSFRNTARLVLGFELLKCAQEVTKQPPSSSFIIGIRPSTSVIFKSAREEGG